MKTLTNRQREVLEFIAQFTDDNMYPPTVREIGEHFGISLRAVQDHVSALQKKGYLSLSQKRSRSIRVLKDERKNLPINSNMTSIPLLNPTVEPGKQPLQEGTIQTQLNVALPFIQLEKKYAALKILDDSMIQAGILPGDIAIFELSETAQEGQIVAALVDNNVLLRRFFPESNRVRFQSENPQVQALYCQGANIIGILSGVIRSC